MGLGSAPESLTPLAAPFLGGARGRALGARLGGVAFLLIAEYLGISVLIDARDLAAALHVGWLAGVGEVARGAAVIAVAALLFALPDATKRLTEAPEEALAPHGDRRLLAFHLVSYVALFALTLFVVRLAPPDAGAPALVSLSAIALLGVATLSSLTRFALPRPLVEWFLPAIARSLGVGAAIGVGAWVASRGSMLLWPHVAQAALTMVVGLLRLFTDAVTVVPAENVVGVGGFEVEIAPSCSGLEGVGLAFALLGGYVWYFRARLRFPHALLLIPLGTSLVWLANTLRIALLVLVGAHISPTLAVGGFHSKAGWVSFCLVAAGTIYVSRSTLFFSRDVGSEPGDEVDNPTATFLLPAMAWVAAGMLTGLLAESVDLFYGLRIVAAGLVVFSLRREIPWPELAPSLRGAAYGALAYLVWVALADDGGAGMPAALESLSPAARGGWIAARALGAVIIVPLVEELAFRGYVLRRLQAPDFEPGARPRFTLLSFVLSSLLFGALHSSFLAGTLTGAVFALAYLHRGRLGDAVMAHAVANLLLVGNVLLLGQWGYW